MFSRGVGGVFLHLGTGLAPNFPLLLTAVGALSSRVPSLDHVRSPHQAIGVLPPPPGSRSLPLPLFVLSGTSGWAVGGAVWAGRGHLEEAGVAQDH